MADEELLAILKKGAKAWNERRKWILFARPDLRGSDLRLAHLEKADLRGVDLREADLRGADLRGADLREAFLSGAHFIEANLHGADLSGADLRGAFLTRADLGGAHLGKVILIGADLGGADLRGANLRGALLSEARFYYTQLREAELSEAVLNLTVFADVDLSEVNGLKEVKHNGPSHVSTDTIYKSKGKIPEVFLRGCGVPDEMIDFVRAIMGKAIQFYSCFISYSSKDEAFAKRVHADLQSNGVRVWFAPEDVKGGEKLYEQIDRAIHTQDKLLLVVSDKSLQSEWVMTEIRRARKVEIEEKRRKLFPIRLVDFETIKQWECFDADSGKDLAVEMREYFIPDFSNWNDPGSYQKAFDRLLRDLKASEST